MTDLVFYLGTHQPAWLWSDTLPADVALFVSHRRLDGGPRGSRTSRYPAARRSWALDSGGFSELSLYGEWRTTPEAYVTAVRRYDTELGRLEWAAPQDWMCEPVMLARTGLTVADHQARTVANFARLQELWYAETDIESPFMPVLQGWALNDYLACWDQYDAAGINLADYPIVGVGSVCRRQDSDEIGQIMAALRRIDDGIPLHGFGVKGEGIRRYGHHMATADSMAWSYGARRDNKPLPGCVGHINCANCPRYALEWRERVLSGSADVQLSLFDLAGVA